MKLVVAIDGEESAKSALQHMLKTKYGSDTRVHLVHVIPPGFADVTVAGIPDIAEEERKEEQSVLDWMADVLKNSLDICASTDVLHGEIADAVAEVCRNDHADEVIVPSHARHGLARMWFGSVADEIADAAPCTAVVLKMQKLLARKPLA